MALTKLSTDNIDLSGNTTALTIPSGVSVNTTDTTGTCNYPTTATALFQFNDNLDNTCGGTAATSSGTSYGTGKFGKSILFNGTSSYATLPNNIGIPSGPWTVSYWFNTNSVTGEEPHMTTDWITGNYTLMIKTSGSTLYVFGYSCAGSPVFNSQPISTTTTIATGTWYHVALVLDNVTLGSGVTLYINGSSEATTTLSSGLCTSATNWLLGDEPGSQHYDGYLDQVRFFNAALTPAQVTELYNETNVTNTTGRPSSPTEGLLRDNTTTGALEFYDGSLWQQIAGTLVRACTTDTCNYPTGAGCQALYQFNSNINDTCGNYNGVSSSNITYAAGQYGNAAQLNGSSSNIFLPDNSNFDLSASQSMSFWVLHNNSSAAWLFSKGNPESYGLWWNGGTFYFTLYAPGYSALTVSGILTNTWYHVVLTVDSAGTGYILYLNGAQVASNTFGAVNTNTSDVRIGSYQGSSLFWNGAIDQLRYFNTTLSSSQVTELYNEVGC